MSCCYPIWDKSQPHLHGSWMFLWHACNTNIFPKPFLLHWLIFLSSVRQLTPLLLGSCFPGKRCHHLSDSTPNSVLPERPLPSPVWWSPQLETYYIVFNSEIRNSESGMILSLTVIEEDWVGTSPPPHQKRCPNAWALGDVLMIQTNHHLLKSVHCSLLILELAVFVITWANSLWCTFVSGCIPILLSLMDD